MSTAQVDFDDLVGVAGEAGGVRDGQDVDGV
jgi:hypothetical protein